MDKDEFNTLLKLLEKHDKDLENSLEIYSDIHRYNLQLSDPDISLIISKYSPQIQKLLHNHHLYLSRNFPIEYRKYTAGGFMDTHRDLVLYKIPQYECVFTLTNSTDSFTILGNKKVRALPNSLLIVRAGGIEHSVYKVHHGERKFLKFIYTETDEFINK